MGAAEEAIRHVEQPRGEPLFFLNLDTAQFYAETMEFMRSDSGKTQIAEHHVAAAIIQTHDSPTTPTDVLKLAESRARLQAILTRASMAPVVYDGDAKIIGLTPHGGTALSYEGGPSALSFNESNDQHYMTKPLLRQVELDVLGRETEGDEVHNTSLEVQMPFTALISGKVSDARDYIERKTPYTPSLVVGHRAVAAYLRAQADHEAGTIEDDGAFDGGLEGFSNSDMLLNMAMLRELGHEPEMGQRRVDAIREAGVDTIARILASSLVGPVRHNNFVRDSDRLQDERILRRTPALSLTPGDASVISVRALELLGESVRATGQENAFKAYAARSGGKMQVYLEDAAGSFLRNILDVGIKAI